MADCGCGSNCSTTCGANCIGTNSMGSLKKSTQVTVTRTITKSISGTNVYRVDNINKKMEVK